MTPEQLQRAAECRRKRAELERMIQTVPREVIDGGIVRVRAWKTAVSKANKVLGQDVKDPAKFDECARGLTFAQHGDVDAINAAAAAAR